MEKHTKCNRCATCTCNENPSKRIKTVKYFCYKCNLSFIDVYSFNNHKRNHNKSKPCPICKKVFSRPDNLKKHIENIHNGKKFTCRYCGKGDMAENTKYWHESRCEKNENNIYNR